MSSTPLIREAVLDRLVNAVIESTRTVSGLLAPEIPGGPWRESPSRQVPEVLDTDEYRITIHVLPGGLRASVQVEAVSSKCLSIYGQVDLNELAKKLV